MSLTHTDVVEARLIQAHAAILAIQNGWDNEAGEFILPPKHLQNALWAVEELLAQANKAVEQISSDAGPAPLLAAA